jgi:serine/threonine-protein kinase
MGVVWKARHSVLNVVRALKMLPAGSDADPEAMIRFCREGEAVARLDHENIVRIHEFGELEGRLYCVMEYLDGGTLTQRLQVQRLSAREAAELVALLARAVHHAHEHGVVHRDLKPSNVLFTSDGVPKLADFGLAKILDESNAVHTRTHVVLGTPRYMAPEQASGQARAVGPAADVWALGTILYECLTGQPAFQAGRSKEVLPLVQKAEVRLPSRLCPGLPADLEAVCLKCLQKEPGDRYASAGDLAEDLERWLAGQPTRARPFTSLQRLGQVVRRRRWVVAALALVLALLGAGVATAFYFAPEQRAARITTALARGETVVLIGEQGGPQWSRWACGAGASKTEIAPDGTFQLITWGHVLFELVPTRGRRATHGPAWGCTWSPPARKMRPTM